MLHVYGLAGFEKTGKTCARLHGREHKGLLATGAFLCQLGGHDPT